MYGGSPIGEQINAIKRGSEILVATPGRLIDILCTNQGRVLSLARITYVVMDEADRMFDMGFEPQIMKIIDNIRPDRQTVLFSATFPKSVENLAKKALASPVEIIIGGRSVASSNVTQIVEIRNKDQKFTRLLELLGQWYPKGDQILIFVDKQENVDKLFQNLLNAGYDALTLHGGIDQIDRDYTIADFKNKLRILMVATSVVARGLDVKDLALVINYEVPHDYEDYVHRVGRTGRAGKTGTAITFIEPDEEAQSIDLIKALEAAKQTIPADLQQMADTFKEKVRKGEVKAYRSDGYRTTGGFKFDESEEKARQDQEMMVRMGQIASEVGEAFEELEAMKKEKEDAKEADAKSKPAAKPAELDPIKKQLAAAKAAMQAAAAKAAGDAGGAAGAGGAAKALAIALSMKQELQKASAQAALQQVVEKMQPTAAASSGPPEAKRDPNVQVFTEEVEINDYPQIARWKAMKKDALPADLLDNSDVLLSLKGTYIPPGRKVPEGQRKLYCQIEGSNQMDVTRAKAELIRLLEEFSKDAKPDAELYARYSVI